MTETERVEQALLKTRKSVMQVCQELNLPMPDRDEMLVEQCSHCSVWHKNYKLNEDLDGNPICQYCEDLVGR